MQLFLVRVAIAAFLLAPIWPPASAQTAGESRTYGPFNVSLITSGLGWKRDLSHELSIPPTSPWSISCRVKSEEPPAHTWIGGIGESSPNSSPRYFAIENGKLTLWLSRLGSLQDPQVTTRLPLPNTDHADVSIAVPLFNDSNAAVQGTLTASFEGVKISKNVSADPGKSLVTLTPAEFRQLSLDNPRLWCGRMAMEDPNFLI